MFQIIPESGNYLGFFYSLCYHLHLLTANCLLQCLVVVFTEHIKPEKKEEKSTTYIDARQCVIAAESCSSLQTELSPLFVAGTATTRGSLEAKSWSVLVEWGCALCLGIKHSSALAENRREMEINLCFRTLVAWCEYILIGLQRKFCT